MATTPVFRPVTPAIVAALEAVVGAAHVVRPGPDLDRFSHDESEDLFAAPEVAVRPGSTAEVAAVLALAHRERVPVTPRAAGTGLSGGALPLHGGIVLSVERMDRILEVDEANLVAVVQPGVVTERLQQDVEARGLYYPPDPASRGSCTLGGNIAENAGGPHCVKYGLTKDYVLSLEAVTADGRVFRTGGKVRKDVAGYDLAHLIVGSEGTLAVVTEATLRLIPLPRFRRVVFAPFPDLDAAARAIPALARARITPSALELMERSALAAAQAHLQRSIPGGEAEASLIVEVDGHDEAVVEADLVRVGEVLAEAGATDVVLADSPQKERDLWRIRRCIGEAVKKIASYVECDTAVPPSKVPDLLRGVRAAAARYGVRQISYGHAGDGNLHVNVLSDDPDPGHRERALRPAIEAIYAVATSLGGTITGEHGVGCVAARYLPTCRDANAIAVMRAVKDALDPAGILNPGKVLDGPDFHAIPRRPKRRAATP
ncbi:MAG: FAD-linked oxidase C-terminal domain-containing protein [Planctomycetota bacterium]